MPQLTGLSVGFLYGLLATLVWLRLGRRPGASGREEKLLLMVGWLLVGLSFGTAALLVLTVGMFAI
jgi:hypothetical protein